MKLLQALRRECLAAGMSFPDKPAALKAIVRLAKASPVLKDVPEADILSGLKDRESLGSTGFGGGIAIPHCRLASIPEFVVGVISVPGGVEFDAADGEKVQLLVFILGPECEPDAHIRLLCAVSQVLSAPGAVEEMVAATDAEALRQGLTRHAQEELAAAAAEDAGRNLIHVICRNDRIFHDVLQVLSMVEAGSAVVVGAESVGAYLSKIPLFADFWGDGPGESTRIIVALVGKPITNEAIRRIERVTGPLQDRSDVLVTVQEVFYSAGSLGA